MRRIAFLLGTSLLLSSAPFIASAQSFTGVTPLTLTASPVFPHPYATVTITPNSTSASLSSLTLVWKVNGKTAGSTTGSASFSVQVGGPGSVTKVTVSAAAYSASLTLTPSDVELIAEPQTTVHPLYQGSPLVSSQSSVRFVAVADARTGATRIASSKLVYDWKLNDQQLQAQSGIGADTLTVTAPVMYRDATIYVTVSDQSGAVYGQGSYTLTPVSPTVRLYVNDPLKGPLYNAALSGSFVMQDVEESFVAAPYSFSIAPLIAWTIGGNPSSQGPFVTVRSSGSGSGNAVIAAQAKGGELESAGAQSDVSFKSTSPGGILNLFGL